MTSSPSTADTRPGDDDEIASFVHRRAEAIVSNDVERLAGFRFVTDDWLLVNKPDRITRDMFHGVVASGMLHHDTMTHEVLEIRRLGPDVAVVVTYGRNPECSRASRSKPTNGQPTSSFGPTPDGDARSPNSPHANRINLLAESRSVFHRVASAPRAESDRQRQSRTRFGADCE